MAKMKGLGRGLDALLGSDEAAPTPVAAAGDTLGTVPIDALQPGRYQPRKRMDPESLAERARTIHAPGGKQPRLVRPLEAGR